MFTKAQLNHTKYIYLDQYNSIFRGESLQINIFAFGIAD